MTPTETVIIAIERLPHAPESIPEYKTSGSAGMDLQAAIEVPVTLAPLARVLIKTGWQIALPEGFEAQVRARSGLSIKHGVTLVNGVGTIDWDYRDEVQVALVNLSNTPYTIHPGDRIAQLVIAPVTQAKWQVVPHVALLSSSERTGGFGSTGR
jgi:dUTP pyrophosphatase